jgi:hypothetical protein
MPGMHRKQFLPLTDLHDKTHLLFYLARIDEI